MNGFCWKSKVLFVYLFTIDIVCKVILFMGRGGSSHLSNSLNLTHATHWCYGSHVLLHCACETVSGLPSDKLFILWLTLETQVSQLRSFSSEPSRLTRPFINKWIKQSLTPLFPTFLNNIPLVLPLKRSSMFQPYQSFFYFTNNAH